MSNIIKTKYKIVEDDRFLYNLDEQEKQEKQEKQKKQEMKSKSNLPENPTFHSYKTEYSLDIYTEIQKYVATNPKTKIYLLTPCFGGVCYTNYVVALMNTVDFFKKIGIELVVEFCKNDSLVSRARNNLVARAMTDRECTHIIFIDNDITWNPLDIVKLILSDKDLVGGVYPLKHYDWNKITPDFVSKSILRKNASIIKDRISDEDMIQHNLLHYNINCIDSVLSIDNNIARVRHLATGFMLMKRGMIEKMMKAYSQTKYVDDVHFLKSHENEMAYALFDCGVREGHYFSEDWLFCDRWAKLGGEIYIDVSINLCHTGIEDYNGSFFSSIV